MDSESMQSIWDDRYEAKGALWGAEPNRFLVEIVEDLEVGTALDLGCGQGRNSLWLAERGFTATGFDLSPVAVDQASSIAAERGLEVEFGVVDLHEWDPKGRVWDLVVLAYLHLPGEARRKVHDGAKQALAPGGRLVVIAHHLDNLGRGVGGPPDPGLLFTEAQLAADFADLHILRNERVIRTTADGDAVDVVLVATRP